MLAYEEFEARMIVPRVYGRALRLPSSVIFFSLLAGGVLSGIAGALFALPVAAALLMLVEELRVELPGQQEQAADIETRVRDDRGEREYERRAEACPRSWPRPSPWKYRPIARKGIPAGQPAEFVPLVPGRRNLSQRVACENVPGARGPLGNDADDPRCLGR